MDTAIIVAIIAAVTSVFSAILTYFFSNHNQREIEILKSDFDRQKSEQDARLDYIYEARKRLYAECEPLFFQLSEQAEYALRAVQSLARSARLGNLDEDDNGWLSSKNRYYMLATVYKLILPVVIVRLIQRRLTMVDLTVDSKIKLQYNLAKCLYNSFHQDHDIAQIQPELPYTPNDEQAHLLIENEPEKYRFQGIPIGWLDNAIDAFIVKEANNRERYMTFGEFESAIDSSDEKVKKQTDVLFNLFLNFHPKKSPVLWRILIVQSCIYYSLLRIREGQISTEELQSRFFDAFALNETEKEKFDWRKHNREKEDEKVLVEPFNVAERYIKRQLKIDVKVD